MTIQLEIAGDTVSELFKKSKHIFYSEYRRIKESSPDRKFVVSFSGGKDSTVTSIVVLETIKEKNLPLDDFVFIYADTRYEMPSLHQQALRFLDHVEKMGIRTIVIQPKLDSDLLVYAIGKGRGFPQHKLRWCVLYTKVNPIDKALRELGDNMTYIIGIRRGESQTRDNKIDNMATVCDTQNECFVTFEDESRILPIVEWKSCNIWDFIQFYEPAQKYPIDKLRDIYLNHNELRYGCWLCTVATNKTLREFVLMDSAKYSKMYELYRLFLDKYTDRHKSRKSWLYVYEKEYSQSYLKAARSKGWKVKAGSKVISNRLKFSERWFLFEKLKEVNLWYLDNYQMSIVEPEVLEFIKKTIEKEEAFFNENKVLIRRKKELVPAFEYDELVNNGFDI